MVFEVHSNSPEATFALGEKIGRRLIGKEIVLVSGALGVGKTLLAKGIAKGLDIPPSEVVSPSFPLLNLFWGRHRFYHFDLYRLGMEGRVEDPGIDEYIGLGVILVEWAQLLNRVDNSLTDKIEIRIRQASTEIRDILIQTDLDYIEL